MTRGRTALVTGLTGQDGSYAAELLLGKGYRVCGVTRDLAAAPSRLPPTLDGQVDLVKWDYRSQSQISDIVASVQPDEVYNFAAYSSGSGMFDDPIGIGEVNGIAVARLLEAIRAACPRTRLCQASSSEMFCRGAAAVPQTEATPFLPCSPYGAAKLYAHTMVDVYRRHHGIFASAAILYNHESPRRGHAFVTRKVTRAAAAIKLGMQRNVTLGDLKAQRDWGFAGDAVRAMWMMLQVDTPDDFIVATGRLRTVEDLCRCAFGYVGLDYREFVEEDRALFRSADPSRLALVGNPSKAQRVLGWQPSISFEQLIESMVESDLKTISQEILQ